jgi:ABC-type uncharacterized transport system substrate-binding protein
LLALFFLYAGGPCAGNAATVGVVYYSGVPVYLEAIKAMTQFLEGNGIQVLPVELNSSDPNPKLQLLSARAPDLVVAFGFRATRAIAQLGGAGQLISAMVLPDGEFTSMAHEQGDRLAATILLDAAPAQVFARLKRVFPDRRRVAIAYSPAGAQPNKGEILSLANQYGYAIEFIPCSDAKELLRVFQTLRDRVDFVWCLPDTALYQPTVVSQLILASMRERLPIIGFSEGFVRAGAAVGFYADPSDIGLQAGEAARGVLGGQSVARTQAPRSLKFAVNQRVLDFLGYKCRQGCTEEAMQK